MDWIDHLKSKFIVFDGPDGSGKSTQIEKFLTLQKDHDLDIFVTREPGGTSIGEDIRNVLLDPTNSEMSTQTEMLLFMAARAQLIQEKIKPKLSQGYCVLSDRFVSSTIAYQGTAGKMPLLDIMAVSQVVTGGCSPDLTIVFDVDYDTSTRRIDGHDRIEGKGREYHERVRSSFLGQAKMWPDSYIVIDASRDPDTIFKDLCDELSKSLSSQ